MPSSGRVDRWEDRGRHVRVPLWLDLLFQDARYAGRALRRDPGVSALIGVVLALGIGMNTAVFSVFNAVVLRPVAYPDAERLVWLSTVRDDDVPGIVLGPDFVDWREQSASFDRMAAYGTWDAKVITSAGPGRARFAVVTEDFWDLTGVQPSYGRVPRPAERDVVLLSHRCAALWFGDAAGAIGRALQVEERQLTVVGIVPDEFPFHFPAQAWPGFRPKAIDVYEPLDISPVREGMIGLFNVVGRLERGVSLDEARAELDLIHTRIRQEHPNPYRSEAQRMLRVVPLHEQLVGGARFGLFVLMTAVVLVLLIACANAANLLLARASARRRELAIRASLGAGRGRVLRQSAIESLMLALTGCAGGLLVAWVAVAVILRLGPPSVPRLAETTIDGPVLAVTLTLSAVTAFVFGLAPALALWKVNPRDAIRDAARGVSRSAPGGTRGLIVSMQMATALVLLIGAGLMLKSAWRLTAYPPGFEPGRILTMKVEFAGADYTDSPGRQRALVAGLLDGLRGLPGVDAVSLSTHGYSLNDQLVVEGAPPPAGEVVANEPILINATSAELARVLGLRLVRGRWLTDDEPLAVINERLARRDFPGQDPIGRRILIADRWLTIAGVVADLKFSALDRGAEPEVYVPHAQVDGMFGFIALARTTGDPMALAPAIRTLMARLDSTQVPEEVMSLEQVLAETIAPRRWNLFLLATFAVSALVLALIGLYGVMRYWVTRRRQEIGVRLALGARRVEVLQMFVRQGMRYAAGGVGAGMLGALSLTGAMSSLLYEVEPHDPLTFALVPAMLALTALLAACIPAFQATRVDPAIALREE